MLRILIYPLDPDLDPAFKVKPEPVPEFWWPKIGKNAAEKNHFFDKKIAIYLSLAVREAFSSKDNIQHLIFALLRIRIRIQGTPLNPDPDTQK